MRPTAPPIVGLTLTACFAAHEPGLGEDAGAVTLDARIGEPRDAGAAPLDGPLDDDWFEDTLGWRVRFDCRDAHCAAPGLDTPADHPVRCPDGQRPYVANAIDGRVITLLATCDNGRGWYGWPEVARPIVCESDARCARLAHAHGTPRCVDGVCQVPEEPLEQSDVLMYCMAYVARPTTAPTYPLSPPLARAWQLAEEACPDGGDVCAAPHECALRR